MILDSPTGLFLFKYMITYITLLRGINVGGHRLIKMKELQLLCESIGFSNMQTYIQSGNLVYQFDEKNVNIIDKQIENIIESTFGFKVPSQTFSLHQYENLINSNPFLNQKSKELESLHVTFLSKIPEQVQIDQIKSTYDSIEDFIFKDRCVYLYCPKGTIQFKLTNTILERKLSLYASTRNWKTATKLLELAQKLP